MEEIRKASENALTLDVVARIRNDFPTKFGLPRQSGLSSSLISKIVFEPDYRNPDLLRGIEGYSHLWLIWGFSEVFGEKWSPTVRPPRLGGNTRMGVFATRAPYRPNPIALTLVKLERIEKTSDGLVLIVSGADIMDKSPIYDIKPYLPYVDICEGASDGFTAQTKDYFLEVEFPEELLSVVPKEKRDTLIEALAGDPRPAYHKDKERIYGFEYSDFEIKFRVEDSVLHVCSVDKRENSIKSDN
jgi:tRNA-Thr(GGU) m(6)t(6)A37 methyltransferase TsaA